MTRIYKNIFSVYAEEQDRKFTKLLVYKENSTYNEILIASADLTYCEDEELYYITLFHSNMYTLFLDLKKISDHLDFALYSINTNTSDETLVD